MFHLAAIYPARSPESSNISFESGYDSNYIAQAVHNSSSSLSTERK